MGHAINVECSECDDQQEYRLGVGRRYGCLENVISLVHWRTRIKITDFKATGTIISEIFEHKLYYCKKCNTAHSRFCITLEEDNGEIFETNFKCHKCRSQMIEGRIDFTKCSCSSCGEKTLIVGCDRSWD